MTYIIIDYFGEDGNSYQINISDETYEGDINYLNGYGVLSYPKSEVMQTVRGSEMQIFLEANVDNLSILERLIERTGDRNFKVRLFQNGSTLWSGWIKPDGIIENWVSDRWEIQIQALCGLGLLGNTRFVNADGEQYVGLVKELDLLCRCLELTGHEINLRLYDINMLFTVDDEADPILYFFNGITESYVNADRFRSQDENNSTFDAKKVLEGVLKKYGCCVYQFGNRWNVVRVKRFFNSFGINPYNDYNLAGVFLTRNSSDQRRKDLYSYVSGNTPFHCSENQQIKHNSSLGGYKVVYKYGFLRNIIDNGDLFFTNGATIANWTNFGTNFVDYRAPAPYPSRPVIFAQSPIGGSPYDLLFRSTTDPDLVQGNTLRVEISGRALHVRQIMRLKFRVVFVGVSSTVYGLKDDGEWAVGAFDIFAYNNTVSAFFQANILYKYEITSAVLPENGVVRVELFNGFSDGIFMDADGGFFETQVVVNGNTANNFSGESHTATRNDNPSSVVSLEDEIYSGDNAEDLYIGSIKNSGGANSLLWLQGNGGSNILKDKLLLEHLATDRLIIGGENAKEFSGDVKGFLPYHGRLTINGLAGFFMTTQYSWNTKTDIINATHVKITTDNNLLDVINYEFAFEGDIIVRPSVVSS